MSMLTLQNPLFRIMSYQNIIGSITRYWWVPLITGILSIAIGIWCFCNPVESLTVLAYFFAACLCASGLLNLFYSLSNLRGYGWISMMAIGLLEIICGGWMFFLPAAVLTTVFVYAVGIYLIFVCICSISEACSLMSYSSTWVAWLVGFLLATLVFAVIFLAGPIVGGIAAWLYIGLSFIFFGIYRIILSAQIRKINKMA